MSRRLGSGGVRPLTIYLLKSAVRRAEDAIDGSAEVRRLPVQIGSRAATLFVKPSKVVPPAWVGFFEGRVNFDEVLLRSASSAAVLVLQTAKRWFAVTFGYGRHMLAQGAWEPNFGLKVTLNSIDRAKIRSIDRKSFDSIARHTREEASRAGSIEQFGINVEEDLLRAVVGRPKNRALARRMAGMDALTATTDATLVELPHYAKRYSSNGNEESTGNGTHGSTMSRKSETDDKWRNSIDNWSSAWPISRWKMRGSPCPFRSIGRRSGDFGIRHQRRQRRTTTSILKNS